MGVASLVNALVNSVVGAVIWSSTGYLKNASKKKEKFDWYKFLRSIIIGIFVGLFSGYLNLPYDQATLLVINTGAIAIVDNITKAVWHKIKPYLVEVGLEPQSIISRILD